MRQLTEHEQQELEAFLDGELPPRQAVEVSARVKNDPAYAAAAKEYQQLDSLLDCWQIEPMQSSITQSVMSRANSRPRHVNIARIFFPLAAAAMLFLAVIAWQSLQPEHNTSTARATAEGEIQVEDVLSQVSDPDRFVVENLDLFQDYDFLADHLWDSLADASPQDAHVSVDRQLQLKRKLLLGEQTVLSSLRHNILTWETLAPEQRQMFRDRAYAFRDAPPQEQQAIVDAYENFISLSDEQKEDYRRRADWLKAILDNLSEDEKENLRLLSPTDRARELMRLKSQISLEE